MPEQQRGQLGPGAQQGQQGDDGVVYLGRSSFKMKVGANLTPPAGSPPAVRKKPTPAAATQPVGMARPSLGVTPPPVLTTPSPVLTTPPPVLTTPPPVMAAPRPSVSAYRRSSVPLPVLDPSVPAPAKTRMLVTGLCMIAFSCGVMTTEAVERFWPRSRAGGSAASVAPATGFEVTREPAIPAAEPAKITPLPASDPNPADRTAPAPSPAVKPAAEAAPPEPAAPAPAVAAAPKSAPAAAVQPSPAHVSHAAPAARATAQGRVAARKRPSAGAQPSTGETLPPTQSGWADPFAQ